MPSRALLPAAERRAGLTGALLGTLPGRAIVIGLAIKVVIALLAQVAGSVPAFLRIVATVAGLAIAAGATYFLFRLSVIAKRRLLWRVRRKLILSYIFIGFVPALLIVAFFLLCGYLLFYNFGSYLVQSRLRALSEQARFLAQGTALEIQRASGRGVEFIVDRRMTNNAEEFPDLSLAVIPVQRECEGANAAATPISVEPQAMGPWLHVEPPRTVPSWIPCSGFSGVFAYAHPRVAAAPDEDTHLLVRGVAFPDATRPGYAVVVDLLVNDRVRQQLRQETGVELKNVVPIAGARPGEARPLRGRPGGDGEPRGAGVTGLLSSMPSLMEYRDWTSGASGTVNVTTGLSVSELYDRISTAEGI